jgi:hypothetical protein
LTCSTSTGPSRRGWSRRRECRRISHVTVRCRFTARLYTGRVVRSFVRVHRQRDGLLGFYTTLDVFRDGV